MKTVDLTNVNEAGNFKNLIADAYICRYTTVEDVSNKEYLYMEFDIAEGEFKDYYKDLEKRAGFWGGNCRRSYKQKALPFFKRMCSAVTKSNPGYIFDGGKQNGDESTLVGKFVGIVLREEEYEGNDGNIKTRLVVDYECSVDDVRAGNYTVKPKKELPKEKKAEMDTSFVDVSGDGDEVPFE